MERRLKHISAHRLEKVPDHILHEIESLSQALIEAIDPLFIGKNPNIIMASFNLLHAGIIKALVVDKEDQLKRAVLQECKALIGNTGVKIDLGEYDSYTT